MPAKINNIPEVKAVILDMDGVLVDSEPYHIQAFKIYMDELDLQYDESIIHSFIGHSIRSNIELINDKFIQDKAFNIDEGVEYRDKIYVNLIKQADLTPLPGIYKLVETCQKKNVDLALASSSTREQVNVILDKLSNDGWDLRTIFKSVVTGDDVKNRKPNPEIYEKTIKNLNIPASQTLAVEDSPAGVQAASGADIYCIGLKSIFIPPAQLKDADLLISDIKDIVKILNKNSTT